MNLQHGTSIFVTDGRKALLLRNSGDSLFPDLRLEDKWEQALPADHDLRTDAPGRSFSSNSGGTRRSAYSEPDHHQSAEARFVAGLAATLDQGRVSGSIRELVIVAPPRMLGELRKALPRALCDLVTAEVAKDLVKHPLAEIERVLAGGSDRPAPVRGASAGNGRYA